MPVPTAASAPPLKSSRSPEPVMSLFILNNELLFPPVQSAEPDGLLAIGGDLSTERLLLAYRRGIFPWYEGQHILLGRSDPRFVLFPEELKESKKMRQQFKKKTFYFLLVTAFRGGVTNC